MHEGEGGSKLFTFLHMIRVKVYSNQKSCQEHITQFACMRHWEHELSNTTCGGDLSSATDVLTFQLTGESSPSDR